MAFQDDLATAEASGKKFNVVMDIQTGARAIRYLTAEEMAGAKPPAIKSVSPLDFMDRFTKAEQSAILTASDSSASLKLWLAKLWAARSVGLEDERTIAGLDAVVSAGLLTSERKAAILTP